VDSLAKTLLQHTVDADEAGVGVGGVVVFTILSTTSIITVRTTPLQAPLQPKLRDGVLTLPRTQPQLEGVEEVSLPISDTNNLHETSQVTKAQMCLRTAYRQIINSIPRGYLGRLINNKT
jgi:hypothetical protein